VSLRELLRRMYGRRMAMLHLRTALFAGPEKFDQQAFLWTGLSGHEEKKTTCQGGDRPSDHVVNVLAAKIRETGDVKVEELLKLAAEWGMPNDGA
jgi:hypothetical protein